MSSRHDSLQPPTRREPTESVPLTFSQLWTWTVLELHQARSTRSVTVAQRLSGPLSHQALIDSVVILVRRHDSLRTTIVVSNGIPLQSIATDHGYQLEVIDLSSLPSGARELQAKTLAEQLAHEPIDVAVGPLFAARLLRMGYEDHVLIFTLDHIISDGASVAILLRDLWTLYAQSVRKLPFRLPELPLQFADYAVWERKTHSLWVERHGAYWNKRLSGAARLQLFPRVAVTPTRPRMKLLPFEVAETVCGELRKFVRRSGTTVAMSIFTAYVALLLRWCNTTDVVVSFVTLGRNFPALKHTIGYFGCSTFLRIESRAEDTFLDLLRRVTQEYATAYQHADSGRVAAEIPAPNFAANPRFNWHPGHFNLSSTGEIHELGQETGLGMRHSPFEIAHRTDFDGRGGGPELMLGDSNGIIKGDFWYRADLYQSSAAERFERNLRYFVGLMVTAPRTRVAELSCNESSLGDAFVVADSRG